MMTVTVCKNYDIYILFYNISNTDLFAVWNHINIYCFCPNYNTQQCCYLNRKYNLLLIFSEQDIFGLIMLVVNAL